MHLEELSVVNFRNLKTQSLKFSPGVNIFWGDNAQGKTNLLEAIYLLSTAKSFRARTDHELLNWGTEEAKVVGQADNLNIELLITASKKTLQVNKQPKRLTEIIGSFITVLFTPSDLALINGAPTERRRFLDQLGCLISREYLQQLAGFNHLLRSRNQVLWQLSLKPNLSTGEQESTLLVWDEQLSKAGSFLWEFRQHLTVLLNTKLATLGKKLLGAKLLIDYEKPFAETSRPEIGKRYLRALLATRSEELRKKQTLSGPQRDNFKVIFEEEGPERVVSKDLGIYGSRGEQRAAALALKLAEVEIIQEETKIKPTLLLDEVLSELDDKHRRLLLKTIFSGQTFITSTSLEVVEAVLRGQATTFKVSDGEVISD